MAATIIYNIGIQIYRAGVALAAATGNAKARRWEEGRHNWREHMQRQLAGAGLLVWIHAASLGEFEQGRPILESIRLQYPGYKILLTFFSPSGYEVRKDYKGADYIFYLPLDTTRNARDFIALVNPSLAIFIKYEFWYHLLTELYRKQVPVLLVSGIFRPGQIFFKPYGGMFRSLLRRLTHIFVQNDQSLELLKQAGITHVSLAGDTRFDRVWALRKEARELPVIERFIAGRQSVVAGSTWAEDEELLAVWWRQHVHPGRCLIIAPHEIEPSHINKLMEQFPGALRFTEWVNMDITSATVLIIDNVGMLSVLYRYAVVTYVGGGFGKDGIHNILEPATYGKPVLFGPVFHKYPEAAALLAAGGGATVKDLDTLTAQIETLLLDNVVCAQTGERAGQYVADNKGATEKILQYIQEKRFLTKA